MTPAKLPIASDNAPEFDAEFCVPNVVVVDPQFDAYKDLAAAARQGKINLHFRSSGADAIKLARRTRVDVWLVAAELDDVSGADFVTLLQSRLGMAQLAIVESSGSTAVTPAAAVLSPPITMADVEQLLGRSAAEPPVLPFVASTATRPFVTLPMGVSAAVAAVAVLILG
jgi:hypothetical protein